MSSPEYWVVCGPTWRLPIRIVEWHDTMAELAADSPVPLLQCQQAALKEMLEPVVFTRGGKSWAFKPDLQKVAHVATAQDAESLVEWMPGVRKGASAEFQDNEFIRAYCASDYAVGKDPVIMDAIWVSFLKFCLHWLVNEEKEIDFGFARIIPLFLRKNWSNVAAKAELREYRKHIILRSDFLNPDPDSIIERRILDYLATGYVASIDGSSRLPRSILEVIESPAYRDAVTNREKARKYRWRGAYWKQFVDRMKRQLPKVLECYAYHLKEAEFSAARIGREPDNSGQNKWKGSYVGFSLEVPVDHCGEDCLLWPGIEPSQPKLSRSADSNLPPVSNLQSPEGDVRDTGPDVQR